MMIRKTADKICTLGERHIKTLWLKGQKKFKKGNMVINR